MVSYTNDPTFIKINLTLVIIHHYRAGQASPEAAPDIRSFSIIEMYPINETGGGAKGAAGAGGVGGGNGGVGVGVSFTLRVLSSSAQQLPQ